MNAQSSRGHTVFKLNMVREGGSDNLSTTSEVCFADLAGRENEKTTQVTGERFVELSFINKSLLYLSGCIQSLGHQPHRRRLQTDHGSGTPKSKGVDMSRFRNSKLTLLLSNALSGNSRTSMIGTLSPAAAHFEESHNTLRFASTVKTIKVQAKAARAVDKMADEDHYKAEAAAHALIWNSRYHDDVFAGFMYVGTKAALLFAMAHLGPLAEPLKLLDGRLMPRSKPGPETYNAVKWALEMGYRLVDTAALYRNEKSVGEAIRDSGLSREDVWITTKLWDSDHGYEATLKACQNSLHQLGLSYIDLYLIHSPNTGKLVETWDAMIELQRRGVVRSIGVSNFGVPHLEALRSSGRQLPVVNQIEMHPMVYQERKPVLEFCAAHGIKITAYGSMFSGQQEQLGRKEVAQVLAAHPSKTPAQILLRWGLQMDFQVIPKSVRRERLEENMNLMDFELTPGEMESLSAMRGALHEYWNPLKSKVDLGRTDSLVKQLQLEVQQLKLGGPEANGLKLQLEQAQEKHDDEDIREINVQLEATTAIVARQTRDWMVFQQESAELSRKRTKTMESLMAHSLGDCPPPYLANYSEDPHLAFRLVMPVAADGEEHSLGSGASCSFRLPPSLGVCDITGYIRNEEGRLWLRPEPLPRASTRPASIEVNGEKLSLEPLELQHLDCVLFGRSTIFYVFLQKVSPEELTAKLRSPYDIDKEEWEGGLTQKVVNSILGEARTDDPLERELARVYCNQLQSQNRDTQGTFMLRAFLQRAKRARLKVDEANDLTACIRPKSGLHFELVSQAPVLSYGFATHGNLPELSVRLVQRIAPLHRFRRAAWKLMAATKGTRIKEARVPVEEQSVDLEEWQRMLTSVRPAEEKWASFVRRMQNCNSYFTPSEKVLTLHSDWISTAPGKQLGRRGATVHQSDPAIEGQPPLKGGAEEMSHMLKRGCSKLILLPQSNIRLTMSILGLIAIVWDVVFIPIQAFDDLPVYFDDFLMQMTYAVFAYWFLDFLLQFVSSPETGNLAATAFSSSRLEPWGRLAACPLLSWASDQRLV
ncbi:unnamed protein product [Symbiodinium sp. KB8]|nr:unnamed protein product [Symbiodinium sp. KB8]